MRETRYGYTSGGNERWLHHAAGFTLLGVIGLAVVSPVVAKTFFPQRATPSVQPDGTSNPGDIPRLLTDEERQAWEARGKLIEEMMRLREQQDSAPADPAVTTPENQENPETDETEELSFNQELKAFMILQEGRRSKVYECGSGCSTIAIGFNLDAQNNDAQFKKALGCDDTFLQQVANGAQSLTDDQIDALYQSEIKEVTAFLQENAPGFENLADHQKMALISLTYQSRKYVGKDMRRYLQEGQMDKIVAEILYGCDKDGEYTNRRNREAALFAGVEDVAMIRAGYPASLLDDAPSLAHLQNTGSSR